MARNAFLVKYKRPAPTGTGTDDYRTTCSCIDRVANFLDIKTRVYTPSPDDLVDRAEYTRSVPKADGTYVDVVVPARKRVYIANTRAGVKKVQLKTGLKTSQGTNRRLSFTFPSFMSVAEIADALGELIPATKVNNTGTLAATEVAPFFSIVGGRTYPIVPSAVATASIVPDVATTEAEQVTIATTTKSRKRKPKALTP